MCLVVHASVFGIVSELDFARRITTEMCGESRRWQTCNMSVNADFQPDYLLDYGDLLPPMLADGVRAMIYVGMEVILGRVGLPRLAFLGFKSTCQLLIGLISVYGSFTLED